MSKRAERRHQNQRVKAKARRFYHEQCSQLGEVPDSEFEARFIHFADHLKSCSCHMCGNPRRYLKDEKETVQEIKAKMKMKDE